jgi:hypothetical protein
MLSGVVFLLVGMLFITASPAAAAPPAEEIGYLLSYLDRSACKFNRNGRWYSATEARAHLERKYRYLADQDSIATTEDFISLAATSSSMSGKPYQVQCAGEEPVSSAAWLRTELQRIRQASIARPR